jgi:hypothetical protein
VRTSNQIVPRIRPTHSGAVVPHGAAQISRSTGQTCSTFALCGMRPIRTRFFPIKSWAGNKTVALAYALLV